MSAQPALFLHERDPSAPPLQLRVAIGRMESASDACVVIAGSERDNAAWWDRRYPNCAPHRMASFSEVIA